MFHGPALFSCFFALGVVQSRTRGAERVLLVQHQDGKF